MIHHRTYSNESGGTAVSDGPCLSTPSEGVPEWQYTTYAATGEAIDGTALQSVTENQLLFSQGLTSTSNYSKLPQRQTLIMPGAPSAYHTVASGSEDLCRENITWPSVLHATSELLLRSSNDDSWNPLEHRVPRFTPAYTAFAPDSPPESVIDDKPKSPADSKQKATRKKTKKAASKGAKPKGISWQHTVVMNGGLQSVPDVTGEGPSQNQRTFGVRKGALDPETKEKARKIRKLKACWSCWVLKVPVRNQTGLASSLDLPTLDAIVILQLY